MDSNFAPFDSPDNIDVTQRVFGYDTMKCCGLIGSGSLSHRRRRPARQCTVLGSAFSRQYSRRGSRARYVPRRPARRLVLPPDSFPNLLEPSGGGRSTWTPAGRREVPRVRSLREGAAGEDQGYGVFGSKPRGPFQQRSCPLFIKDSQRQLRGPIAAVFQR